MRTYGLFLLTVCLTMSSFHFQALNGNQRNFYTHIQTYSSNINTSQGHVSSLIECVSGCFMNENSSFLYQEQLKLCQCYPDPLDVDADESTDKTNQTDLLYGYYLYGYQRYQIGYFEPWQIFPKHKDCLSLYQRFSLEDGVYTIYPSGDVGVTTWCDMANGGWAVIQRRQNGQENFNRTWEEYVNGFGTKESEYWLGLETVHKLTEILSILYIEMDAFGSVTPTSAYATYSSFRVNDISTNYTMEVSGYSGDCGDSLTYHSGTQFTTMDRDNDGSPGNCAVIFGGGWWFDDCHLSNLNGLYLAGNHSLFGNGVTWNTCWGFHHSMKSSVMKVKSLN